MEDEGEGGVQEDSQVPALNTSMYESILYVKTLVKQRRKLRGGRIR